MMNQWFHVRLVDYRPVDIWFIIGLISAVFLLPLLLMPLLRGLPFSFFIGWTVTGFFIVWRYARIRVFGTQISVLADRVLISGLAAGRTAEVLFEQVVSYRYMVTRGGDVVRFTLADGNRVKLIANSLFGAIGGFVGMVEAFMQVVAQYHLDHPAMMSPDTNIL
ncbi:hypothetical protein [Hymenobacter rubidus]|uniref:hypothetical protein n=1 Tax=Hymenobacter rubidus TaxID=1441626 RepID=UPI00191DD3CC|nr:hypothetical protein [Hymenobacter rubidus]